MAPTRTPQAASIAGVVCAFTAFLAWGFMPVYFKAVQAAGALEMASHRVVWAALLLIPTTLLLRNPREILAVLGSPKRVGICAVTALLISGNWLLYVWAVNTDQIVDASLGYYLNPLINVILGVVFLRERLNRPQLLAIGLACLGVAVLVLRLGRLPWLSIVLPLQFAFYALVRKRAGLDPLVGLMTETLLLAPFAAGCIAWLSMRGQAAFLEHGFAFDALLSFAGVITAVPLVLFLIGAQRLRMATIGLIQYVSPTCALLVAVFLYGEVFTRDHALAFAFIWTGLAIYTADALLRARQEASQVATYSAPSAS